MTSRIVDGVEGVPDPTSPISNAVVVGDMCWISGQVASGDDGVYRRASVREESLRALEIVMRIAEAAGFDADQIVYVDVAFEDISDLVEFNEVFAERFASGRRPARTVYQAARLPFDARLKVQAVCAR